MLYVYCPEDDRLKLFKVLEENNIEFVINDYSLRNVKGFQLSHYNSAKLTTEEKQFLVMAIKYGAKVEPLISLLDRKLGYTEISLLHNYYFLHQKAFSILSNSSQKIIKRTLDLTFVFLLSFIAIPLGVITAISLKLESKGPVFFKQRRTGLYNKEFEVIKFRSMNVDAEKYGAKWAEKDDDRITKVGKIIRKIRIDELPQLINVLKGEMSIIGPRPEREVFIVSLEKDIPFYRFRHAIRPGITGLAQVKYSYGLSTEDAMNKHKFDIYYIKHQSIFLDLKVLFLTVKTVLLGAGH